MINKVELLPLKEKKNNKAGHSIWDKLTGMLSKFKLNTIVINIMALFISRAVIMDGLSPFGIAFLAAYLGKVGNSITIPLVSSIGLISIQGNGSVGYLIALWTIYFFYRIIVSRFKITTLKLSIFSSIVFILTKWTYIIISDYYLYDIILSAFEGIIIFTLTYIFSHSMATVKGNLNRLFLSEEVICGAIMIALVISGFGDLSFLTLSFQSIMGVFIVIFFAYIKGASIGAAVGITIGLIVSMSTPNLPIILSVYGFAGLLAGLFRDIGKLGSVVGFAMGNGIMSFYINGTVGTIIGMEEMTVAAIGFILIASVTKQLNSKILVGVSRSIEVEDRYNERIKDITYNRLKEISQVFEELGLTFKKVADKEKILGQKDISKFVDNVVEDVCKECSMCNFCWGSDFYTTYHSMFELMGLIEMNGEVPEDRLPEDFKKRCVKPKAIIEKCVYIFDMYKLNHRWENKILESRQLVSQQLDGVSKIIKDLANEVQSNIRFKEDIEREIIVELENNNIEVKEVIVTESDGDSFEIFIEAKNTTKRDEYERRILEVTSEIVGFQLVKDKFIYNVPKDNKTIKFKLIKANRYGAITRVARSEESFNYVSGDSYTFGERSNNYFVALSDGMGIGKRANQESNITISLLERFLEAGFDKELALKTINSILVLKSNDEMLATIDMSIIDLYMGKTQFIKIGSAPTFIKRKDRIQIINSHSLPVGILKDVDFQLYEEDLEDGDLVIMMSDGVLDANEEVDNKEKWMLQVIDEIDSLNPQTMADEIIKRSTEVCPSETKDDMTVLVTKIWRRR